MRVWRNVLIVALVAAALVALLIAAHGANDRNQAREAAHGFLKAMAAGDQAAAERALTRRAREMMQSSDMLSGPKGKTGSGGYTLGDPLVRDDAASVPVTMKDDSGSTDATIQLRREEGEWRVRGMAFATYPGGPKFNLDFENPQDVLPEAFRTAGFAFGQMTRGIQDGAAAFAKGFEQGYHGPAPQSTDHGSIEEIPSPAAPEDKR
jgi:hypothetical protein